MVIRSLPQSGIKEYVLANINQVEIFVYYANTYGAGKLIANDVVKSLHRNSYMVQNPLRPDTTASLSFRMDGNKIIATDFGNNYYSGDCFHFAAIALGLHCNNPRHFIKVCKDIINNVTGENVAIAISNAEKLEKLKNKVELDIGVRNFTLQDYKIWMPWGITKESLHREVIAVQSYELHINNNVKSRYYHSYGDPCYAYNLGTMKGINRYKLYFPLRRHKNAIRFITNNHFNIDDIIRMKECKHGILIKSIKDRILLNQILAELYIIDTVHSIAISSESVILSDKEVNLINKLYKYTSTFFDNDKSGLDAMINYRHAYGYNSIYQSYLIRAVYPELIPSHLQHETVIVHKSIPKDLTDFCKTYGYDMTVNLIKQLLNDLL